MCFGWQQAVELPSGSLNWLQVDTVVTALHRNMDTLKKQKQLLLESMKGLYDMVSRITLAVTHASELVRQEDRQSAREVLQALDAGDAAWAPAIKELQEKLQLLLDAAEKGREREEFAGQEVNVMRYARLQQEQVPLET